LRLVARSTLVEEISTMPKKHGVDMPSTLQRSPEKAERTYAETLKHAEAEYGKGERAGRTAYSSLKHSFEKVGGHWEPKYHKGPSDPRSTQSTREKREGKGETFGGVDEIGHTRTELYERAPSAGSKAEPRPAAVRGLHGVVQAPRETLLMKVKVHGFAISLDRYSAGPNQDLQNPLRIGGPAIFEWFFPTRPPMSRARSPGTTRRRCSASNNRQRAVRAR
jgi:hypothetical protein